MSTIDELFQNKAFQCLDPEKLQIMKTIAEKAKGKSAMEVITLFNQYGSALTKGKPLTSQEKSAMIEVMKQSMTPPEKKKLEEVLAVLQKMGKGI